MNYKGYKLRKNIRKVFGQTVIRFLAFLFKPVVLSYDNKGIVYKLTIKKDKRKKRREFIKRIFRYLDRYNNTCSILVNGIDDENFFDIDMWDGIDKEVLKDQKWLDKNNLVVENIDLPSYMEEYKIPSYYKKDLERKELLMIRRI